MEWLWTATQAYHRPCTAWIVLRESAHCSACGAEIPDRIRAQDDRAGTLEELRLRTQGLSRRFESLRTPPKKEPTLPPARREAQTT